MLALFFYVTGEQPKDKSDLYWLAPLALISLSYSLYENPFLKMVNFLVLPLAFAQFASYTLLPKKIGWNLEYLRNLISARIRFLSKIRPAMAILGSLLPASSRPNVQLVTRILTGIGLLLLISLMVIIPLLSSADVMFAKQMEDIVQWFHDILSFRYLNRIFFLLLFGIFLASLYFSLERKTVQTAIETDQKPKPLMDPIVSGIVLAGVLLLYVIFLYTQMKYLFIDMLPIEFRDTERLVKSGFWQLLALSVINILFFLVYFRKTNKLVQNILKVFTLASLLLLFSAGQRMFMYVWNYGLSYEKFFASYTVIYCALLMIWLLAKLISGRPADPVKFIIFSLLWMYSLLTILPVERMVFAANVQLSERPGSRIKLNELRMLSNDVLPMVVNHRADEEWVKDWCGWYERQQKTLEKKEVYEMNIFNFDSADKQQNKQAFENCQK